MNIYNLCLNSGDFAELVNGHMNYLFGSGLIYNEKLKETRCRRGDCILVHQVSSDGEPTGRTTLAFIDGIRKWNHGENMSLLLLSVSPMSICNTDDGFYHIQEPLPFFDDSEDRETDIYSF